MSEDLEKHTPSEDARRRAAAADLDLDVLRLDDPDTYRMICAVPVMSVAVELVEIAQGPLQTALGDQRLFQARTDGDVLMLAFPGPDAAQLERLDDLMAMSVEAHAIGRYGYYRLVRDRTGTRREFALPTPPEGWEGGETMVGPFSTEAYAQEWAGARVDPRSGITYDILEYAGSWFCDLFRVEQP